MSVVLYADGGSRGNPGIAGAGFVLLEEDKVIYEGVIPLGKGTNNEAEYAGLVGGLSKAIQLGYTSISVFMDSQLVVYQIQGKYRVKAENLIPYYKEATKLKAKFKGFSISHIPRDRNKLADKLSNDAMDLSLL